MARRAYRPAAVAAVAVAIVGCEGLGGGKSQRDRPRPPPESGGADGGGQDSGSGQTPDWVGDLPPVDVKCDDDSSTRLYEQRIEPLFADDRPSSCNDCHLSGLDLEVFVRDTPCETMACMVSMGLVDAENPDESKVLAWIARADPQSDLITQDIVEEEYLGFREWITHSLECGECDGASCEASPDGGLFCPKQPEPQPGYEPAEYDPGGCEDAALLEVFRNTVYASRGRCSPCHFNNQNFDDFLAPQWLDVTGDCESASRNTYWNVLDRGYVDVEDPENSLLLLKPLAEELGGVEHGGHDKFYSVTRDQGYVNFRYFIDRYTACRGD